MWLRRNHVPGVLLLAVEVDRTDLLGKVLLERCWAGVPGAARRPRTAGHLALVVYLSLVELTGGLGTERRPARLGYVSGNPGNPGRLVLVHREPPHRSHPIVQLFIEPRNNCVEATEGKAYQASERR